MFTSQFIRTLSVVALLSAHGCRGTAGSQLKEQTKAPETRHVVYLLGGQSNMAGQTPLTEDLRQLKVPNVEIFCVQPYKFEKDREDYQTDQPRPYWEPLKPCGADPNSFGPELTFAAEAQKADPNAKIYIIKYAHGGTSLGCEWQPNKVSNAYANYGVEGCQRHLSKTAKSADNMRTYKRFLTAMDWGLTALRQRGIEPKIGGMLWFQGEADADGRTEFRFLADSYGENLTHFVRTLRSDLKVPDMPFVLGKIKCGYTVADWNKDTSPVEMIRAAQQKLIDTETFVYGFDSMDLKFQPDNCHYDSPSMKTIGQRFAWALKLRPEEDGPVQTFPEWTR